MRRRGKTPQRAQLCRALADNSIMDADGKVARQAGHAAFVAALALASGEYELAQRLLDSMLRAHLLTRPLDGEDAGELHGASGEW